VNVVKQFLRVRMCDKCLSGYYGDLGLVFMVTCTSRCWCQDWLPSKIAPLLQNTRVESLWSVKMSPHQNNFKSISSQSFNVIKNN